MDYMEYLVSTKDSLSVVDANDIFNEMSKEVYAFDDVAEELFEEFVSAAISYANVRSNWLLLTNEQKMDSDKSRTLKHDSVIIKMDVLSSYLIKNGKEAAWRKELGNSRKRIGDFACYIAYIYGLNAR